MKWPLEKLFKKLRNGKDSKKVWRTCSAIEIAAKKFCYSNGFPRYAKIKDGTVSKSSVRHLKQAFSNETYGLNTMATFISCFLE
jgi:hypothetical protein